VVAQKQRRIFLTENHAVQHRNYPYTRTLCTMPQPHETNRKKPIERKLDSKKNQIANRFGMAPPGVRNNERMRNCRAQREACSSSSECCTAISYRTAWFFWFVFSSKEKMQRKPNERTDMHYGATTDERTNGHRTPKKQESILSYGQTCGGLKNLQNWP